MSKALLIHENGVVENIVYNDYKDLQKLVGGYIEGIHIGESFAYVDEEGKLKGKDVNPLATKIWHDAARKYNYQVNDFIVGKMVLTGQVDNEGNDTDIKQQIIDEIVSKGIVIVGAE